MKLQAFTKTRGNRSQNRFLNLALDLFFPRRCPVCDRPVRPFGRLICRECEDLPERIGRCTCFCCGRDVRPEEEYCSRCSRVRHIYRRGAAVFTYRSMAASIYRFKYGGRREYADYFGREMARRLREQAARGVFPRADLLVPVPLSPARYRRRGFNQARLLADVIARDTGIPVREDLLRRDGETAPMKGMTAAARYKNLKKAFHVYGNDVNLKSIMLIDDIYTTGATMDVCASRLMEAGARSVCFLTLAIGENPLC